MHVPDLRPKNCLSVLSHVQNGQVITFFFHVEPNFDYEFLSSWLLLNCPAYNLYITKPSQMYLFQSIILAGIWMPTNLELKLFITKSDTLRW